MKENNKPRVLFLLHLPPPVHGSSMVGLSIKQSSLINENFQSRYINLLASRNITETGAFSFRKVFHSVATGFRLMYELIFHRPDFAYFALTVSGASFFRDVIFVLIIRLLGVKLVYHLHNKGVSLFENRQIYRFCYKRVFSGARVILLSGYLYDDIKSFVNPHQVDVCFNGVDDSAIGLINDIFENRSLKSADNEIVEILFLSNLIESKGVFDLLAACEILKKKGYLFRCVFIGGEGDVSSSGLLNRIDSSGLTKFVTYEGKKYGQDKIRAFSQADIFVFPTFYSYECFPLVLLEAMTFGLPLISTSEGGIRDIVSDGKTGYLVFKNNPEDLAGKIELLLINSRMRLDMGMAARDKYTSQFTLTHFENRLKDLLLKYAKDFRM